MSTQVQLRRGSTVQHATFTGAAGEVSVDTDKKVAVVHDGATAGGFPLARQSTVDGIVFPHLQGLTLSNNATDATNDIDISIGQASAIDLSAVIKLGTALTKRLDATWAVGNNNGGLDTGAKANSTTYHVWLIRRPDTGVVDALFSTSATNPTMPANYTQKRRIGAVMTDGSGGIRAFRQNGGWFHWIAPATDFGGQAMTAGTAANFALPVPAGIKVLADIAMVLIGASAQPSLGFYGISDPDRGAAVVTNVHAMVGASPDQRACRVNCWTNTARQVSIYSSQTNTFNLYTQGWYDGRDTYV
jgi:hypothetical protein